jgi:hypothetical protein
VATLIEYLESFNRKERFFVVGEALGNPAFRLSSDFRARLGAVFGLAIPDDALVAMDYHLDWIYASLVLDAGDDESAVLPNDERLVSGNQEDIDLLVAFDDERTVQLLLIEAKAETGWTNKQTLSKAERLRRIFGDDGARFAGVTPRFGLLSPRRPEQLESQCWPAWMTRGGEPVWLELHVPDGRRRVTRCDASGRVSAGGGFFRVLRTS